MKSILISIHPKWCELIANGKKTVEVRKNKPKLEVPLKCYIYCTKKREIHKHIFYGYEYSKSTKDYLVLIPPIYRIGGENMAFIAPPIINEQSANNILNGKVIGEFVCDEIKTYDGDFWGDETYESTIHERCELSDGGFECVLIANNEQDDYENIPLLRESCLTWKELRKYVGEDFHTFYTLHISNLKVYENPKELSDFTNLQGEKITRAPQSWCYVRKQKF